MVAVIMPSELKIDGGWMEWVGDMAAAIMPSGS